MSNRYRARAARWAKHENTRLERRELAIELQKAIASGRIYDEDLYEGEHHELDNTPRPRGME